MNGEDEEAPTTLLESANEDDDYISPEFDLPSDDTDDTDEPTPPQRRKMFGGYPSSKKQKFHADEDMNDEEQFALSLLGQPR